MKKVSLNMSVKNSQKYGHRKCKHYQCIYSDRLTGRENEGIWTNGARTKSSKMNNIITDFYEHDIGFQEKNKEILDDNGCFRTYELNEKQKSA